MSTALTKLVSSAGSLRPEIKLSKAIEAFVAVLDEKEQGTFTHLQSQAPPPTGNDVLHITEGLNRRLNSRPYATRLVQILEAVQAVARVGDIVVGGAQNLIASGVWACVKFSLEFSAQFERYFDKVTELFMTLGKSAAIKQDLANLFPESKELQGFMREYLVVVVNLCRAVVSFAKKSIPNRVIYSLGHSLDKELGDFQNELARWAQLINEKASSLAVETQRSTWKSLIAFKGGQELKEWQSKRRRLLQKLSPSQDDFEQTWRRERKRGFSRWILQEGAYKSWLCSDDSGLLCIKGPLGGGKTVAMASLVADLHASGDPKSGTMKSAAASSAAQSSPRVIASFFCQYHDKRTLQPDTIRGSLAHQLLSSLGQEEFAKASVSLDGLEAASSDLSNLISNLESNLPRDREYFVLVDAMDECAIEDATSILEDLCTLSKAIRLRLCVSCRSESSLQLAISRLFSGCLKISMSSPQKDEELRQYITSEIEQRTFDRQLSDELSSLIGQILVQRSQGMYLWVALQIDRLFPWNDEGPLCDADIIAALESLPENLHQAFDRALARIADLRYDRKIFEIVAAATRALTTDELRVALTVEPGDSTWNPSTVANSGPSLVRRCGGGLLEIDEEDETVRFIHHSALQHLLHPADHGPEPCHARFSFSPSDADILMARLCVTYLSFGVLDRRISALSSSKLSAGDMLGAVRSSVSSQLGFVARPLGLMLRINTRSADTDLIRVLKDYVQAKSKPDPVANLLAYANESWIGHLNALKEHRSAGDLHMVLRLVQSDLSHIEKPWGNGDHLDALRWAISGNHPGLFRCLLYAHSPDRDRDAHRELVTAIWDMNPQSFNIHGADWGDIISRCVLVGIMADIFGLDNDKIKHFTDHLKYVLGLGASPDIGLFEDGRLPLETLLEAYPSSKTKNIEPIFALLLAAGAAANATTSRGEPLLFTALRKKWPYAVIDLLNSGADGAAKDADGVTPLGIILQGDHDGRINSLILDTLIPHVPSQQLNSRVKSHSDALPEYPICLALQNGSLADVTLLLKHGALANIPTPLRCMTPLGTALFGGNPKSVELLLGKGANPKVPFFNSRGFLPLVEAAKAGMSSVLRPMVQAGALIDEADETGTTAFQAAAQNRHFKCVKILRDLGARLTAFPSDALFEAIALNMVDQVSLIASMSTSVKPLVVVKDGYWTPLGFVIKHCFLSSSDVPQRTAMVEILLENGADPDEPFKLKDKMWSPYDFAIHRKMHRIAAMLQAASRAKAASDA